MTTHDYPGDTNTPAPADAMTAEADPRSERLVGTTAASEPVSPDTAADPGWQQRADQFAANRDHREGAHSAPAEASAPAEPSAPAAASAPAEVEPSNSTGVEFSDDVRGVGQSSSDTALFADAELDGLRRRWDGVQAGFVDDPKHCVEQADGLVSDVVEQLSSGFAEARSRLEQQWSRGEQASTEDLRVALKRYREFFDRLLAV